MRTPLILVLLLAVGCDNIKPPVSRDTDPADTGRPGACLELSATEVDFGEVALNDLLSTTITISNPCSEELAVTSIEVVEPYQVSPEFLTLQGGGFSTITVFVSPDTYGTFESAITITTNESSVGTDGVLTIPLLAITVSDVDGDGFPTTAAGGTDCDDTDPDVNPDADESWYDGVDQDCDGANDYDQDGDGYDASTDEHDVPDELADCNDSNVEYHPGADDAPYDNRDTNCDDENDWDWDGDGYESAAYGRGSDCNDFDALINRDGEEAFNGADDDCDGETDNDARANNSEYYYDADGNWDRVGYSIALGDLDADGSAEVIIGAPYFDATSASGAGRGGIGIFEGPVLLAAGTHIDRGDNFFDGNGTSDLLGTYVAVIGDHDGDGINDLAVGATGVSSGGSNAGAVYVLGGDDARGGDLGDVMLTVTGTTSSYVGRGIASNIDLDADGMDELILAYASGSNNAVGIQYGDTSPSTTVSVTAMDAKYTTDGGEVAFYRNMPVGGDLDGDGYEDLLVSDGNGDFGNTSSGVAWVLWGQGIEYVASSAGDLDSAGTAIVRGDSASDYDAWTTQLGDDLDGDGDNELWIYNSDEAIYVVEGGTNRRSPFNVATEASTTFTWDTSDPDAEMLRNAGDWNGDGLGDMLVFFEDESGSYGRVEVLPGVLGGSWTMEAGRIGNLEGNTDTTVGDNGNVGYGMAPAPADIDGDGDLDQAVGDAEFNSNHGRAYVLLNKGGTTGE